jgi:Glycosyl transferase family 2
VEGIEVAAAPIILPCFNQLEFTRHCLRALFRNTKPLCELVVIDNGSGDGTGAYLAGVQDASPLPVTVASNATNRGFPAAVNQGLSVARGEYLVLLNNDAVITDSWLEHLIALAGMEIGFGKEERDGQEEEHGTEITTNLTNLTILTNRKITIGLVGPTSGGPGSNWPSPMTCSSSAGGASRGRELKGRSSSARTAASLPRSGELRSGTDGLCR